MTGIFFDIDDTLYSRKDLLIRSARETCARISGAGEELDGETFLKVFYIKSDENFALVESGAITAPESNIWRLEETFKAMGLPCPEGSGRYFAERYSYLQNHITLSPTLEQMMKELRKRSATVPSPETGSAPRFISRGTGCTAATPSLRLGVLTNGESAHQWKKYDMLGLERFIPGKYVIVSGDVGISKPEAGIFRAAEKVMGLQPRDLWLAGDSLKHDIEGAAKAGWHTVWFDRSGKDPAKATAGQSSVKADIRVTDEEGLAEALLSLGP